MKALIETALELKLAVTKVERAFARIGSVSRIIQSTVQARRAARAKRIVSTRTLVNDAKQDSRIDSVELQRRRPKCSASEPAASE